MDASKYKDNKAVASTMDLKRSMNTMNHIFRNHQKKFENSQQVKEYLLKPADTELSTLARKVELLTLAGMNDPFIDMMGFIRDKEFVQK